MHWTHNVWTNFWQPTVYVQQNIFEKTLIKIGSSHLYASFGEFCVQIGRLVGSQWDFKLSEYFETNAIFLQKQRFLPFSKIFQRLTVPRKIIHFGRKRYQKKRKELPAFINVFSKISWGHERSAVKNAFSTLHME